MSVHLSRVTQPVKNRAKIHTALPISPSSPGDVLDSRRSSGLGLEGRSIFWSQLDTALPWASASDFPSPEHKEKVWLSDWEWLRVRTWERGSLDPNLGASYFTN